MKRLFATPWLVGVVLGLLLLLVCSLVPIPMYDGIAYYKRGLVDFHSERKLALSYFFGIGTERLTLLGIQPTSFQLKNIGYVLFVLIHIGLPALVALRIHFAQQRKSAENECQSN
jgi:hypothetical protein